MFYTSWHLTTLRPPIAFTNNFACSAFTLSPTSISIRAFSEIPAPVLFTCGTAGDTLHVLTYPKPNPNWEAPKDISKCANPGNTSIYDFVRWKVLCST
eukprot:3117837-Amphidinium_carterae.1